jgi:hypothetical protein
VPRSSWQQAKDQKKGRKFCISLTDPQKIKFFEIRADQLKKGHPANHSARIVKFLSNSPT